MALCVVYAASPARLLAQSSLTIYNDGRVLVRRSVPLNLPSGSSTQRVDLGPLDPATVFSLDPEVVITAARYDGAVDEPSVLRRAVGQRLLFHRGDFKDTVSALVLGVDPLRLAYPDGRVAFTMPGTPLYPRELVLADPTLSLSMQSAGPRKDVRLGYFTEGASWQASYQAILHGGEARVIGSAVIGAGTLRVQDAEIQLLAGEVNQATPPAVQQRMVARAAAKEAVMMDAASQVSQQRVGEFHLYSLPGRTTLLPGVTSSVALFEPARTRYERTYVVRGEVPFWGYLPQQGEETEVPVEVRYVLERARKSDFGERPLPGGVVRVFEGDSAGRLQLVGEATVEHTPAGENLKVLAGNAFDLTARRVQTSYTTRRDSVKAGYWRTTATADYRVTIKNATDSAVVVEVQEERAGEWKVVSSSVPAEKVSSTVTRFRVRVPARGEVSVAYRVQVIW